MFNNFSQKIVESLKKHTWTFTWIYNDILSSFYDEIILNFEHSKSLGFIFLNKLIMQIQTLKIRRQTECKYKFVHWVPITKKYILNFQFQTYIDLVQEKHMCIYNKSGAGLNRSWKLSIIGGCSKHMVLFYQPLMLPNI